jgi:hypothetical protein
MRLSLSWRPENPHPDADSQWSHPLFGFFRAALKTFHAALREIFDEAAYDRFLASHQLSNSAESYAHFQRDRRATQERRPRCC